MHRDPAETEAVGGAGADMGYGGLRDSLAVSIAQLLLYGARSGLNEVVDRSREGLFRLFVAVFGFGAPGTVLVYGDSGGGRGVLGYVI